MTHCQACGAAVKPTAAECACGESLEPWRVMARSGASLREHGLTLAAEGDFLGAALALLAAALTNPLDDGSLVDAARALIRCGRIAEAIDWLEAAGRGREAAEVLAIARSRLEQSSAGETDAGARTSARKSLLALPILRRTSRLFRRPSKEDLADWERVVRMEADPKLDWRPRGSAIEFFLRGDNRSVHHYIRGLGAWQAGDAASAQTAFRQCVAAEPPVLNPVAYLMYLNRNPSDGGKQPSLGEYAQRYTAQELDQCRTALRERLAQQPKVPG